MLYGLIFGILGALANRVRGGYLKDEWFDGSTQTVRFLWSVVFTFVVFFGIYPYETLEYQEVGWWRVPLLVIFAFCSWSFFGSGAHSIMNFAMWKNEWMHGNTPNDTEIYTEWLPWIFNGKPNSSWSEEWFLLYHILGKGVEGVVRNAVALFPVITIEPLTWCVFVLSGLLWGVLWYFAEVLPRVGALTSWNLGEVFVGFISFFVLGVMLYG